MDRHGDELRANPFSFLESFISRIILTWALRTWFLFVSSSASRSNTHRSPRLCSSGLWLAVVVAQQTFGKPIAALGARLLNIVAGVPGSDEQQASTVYLRFTAVTGAGASSRHGSSGPRRPHRGIAARGMGWKAWSRCSSGSQWSCSWLRGCAGAPSSVFGARPDVDVVALAFRPRVDRHHRDHRRRVARAARDIGWWAGWYGDELKPAPEAQSNSGGMTAWFRVSCLS